MSEMIITWIRWSEPVFLWLIMIIGKNSIENYSCFDLAKIFPMGSWEILKNIEILENIIALISQDEFDWWQVGKYWKIEILENIPALISHKMCLTDGKLRCAIKIGSDSITELVPMHSRVRKMESQCDNYKYIWQIQIRLFFTKHALEFAKNGKPKWLSPLP